jgi:spoIIIJ-associated protein
VKELEVTGKTIEEAKKSALKQLGVEEDKVEFTVVKKGRSGILGMGSGEARVIARVMDSESQSPVSIQEVVAPPTMNEIAEAKIKEAEVSKEAKEVLSNLVKLLGLDAKVKIIPPVNDSPTTLDMEGEDLGILIGRRGQMLASLQYIVRLIVSEKTKTWTSLHVDVAGYKKRRYESLKKLALKLADQVKTTKRSINLEPMPPDERRIIHVTLANHPDITTQSTEVGEKRKVVIQYRKH